MKNSVKNSILHHFADDTNLLCSEIGYGIEIDHFEMTLGQIFRKKNVGSKKIFWTSLTEKTGKKRQKWLKMAFWGPKTLLKVYVRLSNVIILL